MEQSVEEDDLPAPKITNEESENSFNQAGIWSRMWTSVKRFKFSHQKWVRVSSRWHLLKSENSLSSDASSAVDTDGTITDDDASEITEQLQALEKDVHRCVYIQGPLKTKEKPLCSLLDTGAASNIISWEASTRLRQSLGLVLKRQKRAKTFLLANGAEIQVREYMKLAWKTEDADPAAPWTISKFYVLENPGPGLYDSIELIIGRPGLAKAGLRLL